MRLPLSDDTISTKRLQTNAPRSRIICPMTGTVFADAQLTRSPRLRFGPAAWRSKAPPILVAGADMAQRAAVLDELTQRLPKDTRFEEASAFWEVLARAPECRMVIFSGDLEDGAAEALMQTLGQRRPELPAVSLKTASLPLA
jgi:hypothetical protein